MQEEQPTNTADTPPTLENTEDTQRVPVTEAIRYRKRAQAAEQALQSTQEQLQASQQQLQEAQTLIEYLERQQQIDALLTESDAIDLDAARLLTEQTISEMDEPDLQLVISDLKRHKPYLFRHGFDAGSFMPPNDLPNAPHPLDHAAKQAVQTGQRRDLLTYLRLKRRAS